MARTPKCKMCAGTGNVHIDSPNVSKIFDLPCWICGASNFRGMDRKQIAWYLAFHKTLLEIKGKSLRGGELVAPQTWPKMMAKIDEAATKLGIATPAVAKQKAQRYGETDDFLTMAEQFRVYEKRLEQIPVAVAARVVLASVA
jgi:hypothetical protein